MRNLGASCLRYSAQTYAYALLVTSRYPYGGARSCARAEPSRAPCGHPGRRRSSETPSESRSRRARRRGDSQSGRSSSIRPRSPTTSRSPRSTSTRSSARTSSRRRSATSASSTSLWVLAQVALLLTLWVYARRGAGLRARVVGGPDRHRDAPRDARARHRLARPPAVRPRRALVGRGATSRAS